MQFLTIFETFVYILKFKKLNGRKLPTLKKEENKPFILLFLFYQPACRWHFLICLHFC
jgi:hypothetical protein